MGFLTVVAGAGAATCPEQAATDLARQLARQGRQAILLDFTPSGKGLTGELGLAPALGFTDVLLGRAACAEVVRQLANSTAHVIVARSSAEGAAVITDKDRVNMLLDGLAEAYDHIVIAGAYDAVRDLFVTIEGSIDAGVVVAGSEGSERNGYFLGFDAADLKLIHYEPTRARQRAVMLAPAAVAAS